MTRIHNQELQRTIQLDTRAMDEESRTVTAALSSETPVPRWFGTEVLVHEADAINMERADQGLPLLWSHDHESPIGRVENIRLDSDKVLRGDFRFSRNAKASEIWNDVRDGFLRDVSIGYRIDAHEEEDDDIIRVTRFTPLEASIVTVPADARVGINRNHEEVTTMADDKKPETAAEEQTRQHEEPGVAGELRLLRLDKERERKAGAQMERERIRQLDDLFDRYELRFGEGAFSELKTLCLDNTEVTLSRAKAYIDEAILEGHVSVDISARQDTGSAFSGLSGIEGMGRAKATAGADQLDKFQRGAELALSIRAGAVVKPEELKEAQQGEYLSMAPSELAREFLRVNGQRATGNREQVIGQALQYGERAGISHGTGHFASILENVANKSMLDGFEQAEETWSVWTQQRSIPDFKTTSLVNLSLFNGLEQVREGAQYTHGDMSDIKEQIQLATYGRLFTISRQALANDDLSALGDVPRAMGMAAAYQIGDIVYTVLTTGTTTTMVQDSTALFHADHSNYVTAGAAPSVATLNAGRTAMATQTDPQGKTLGIRPGYLIVPIALQTTAETLIAATYDPAGTAGTLTPNPFQNSMTVVADHRLDTANASGWYLAARRNTVTVGFLNGQSTPYLESKDGWSVDGVEHKVRIDAAAVASDFRGLYYNDGVT